MFKRYRIAAIAFGLAAVALATIIVAAGIFTWSQYQTGGRAYQEYQQRTYSEQRKAANQIADNCAVRDAPINVVADCLANGIEAREKKSDTNKDLKAQQDMAFWALGVFVIGAIGLPISIAGLTAIFISLRHTRESIVNDRDIGEAQVRAYLYCVSARFERRKDCVSAVIELANSGNSPASSVKVEGNVNIQMVIGPPERTRVASWANSGINNAVFQPIVASGRASDRITFFWDTDFFTQTEDDDDAELQRFAFEDGNTIWFDLIVSWIDVFGKPHEFPLSLDGIINAHPHKPKQRKARSAPLEIRMEDVRAGTSKMAANQE